MTPKERRAQEHHERLALQYAAQGTASLAVLHQDRASKANALMMLSLALMELAKSDPENKALDLAREIITGNAG